MFPEWLAQATNLPVGACHGTRIGIVGLLLEGCTSAVRRPGIAQQRKAETNAIKRQPVPVGVQVEQEKSLA